MRFLNYSNVIDPLLKGLRIFIVKFADIKAGDRVLDVCCGTGDQAFHYAKTGAIAYGIDLNPDMIEVAEKNKKKLGLVDELYSSSGYANARLDNVSFQVADAKNLPFKDNFFDCASVSFGLHEKERQARNEIISEMKRAVKKGGNLIFIDFQVPLPKGPSSWLIKTVEYFAGTNHYEYFKDYLEQGGLNEILKENQLRIERNERTKNGIVEIIKARNI